MKKIISLCFLLLICSQAFSQTGFRIKLVKNLNPYPTRQYSAIWGYTAPNGREYAILGCFDGTSFIDITDTTNIREVDFLPVPSGVSGSAWREMKTYSHYCYIVSESDDSKVQIVDMLFLPDSIRYVGLSDIPGHTRTHSISQSGPYIYLNGGNSSLEGGIAVLDLSVNPELPVLRGKWNEMYVHDSRIINDTIWACNIDDGKVSIIDARNKDSLRTIRNWTNSPFPNAPHNIALSENRNFAFVTDEVFSFSDPGKLKVWDVSDLGNITYLTSFVPHQFEHAVVHNVEIYQNFAFLAYYMAGVKVLDLSNPANPVEVGWYDTYPESNSSGTGCWGVYYFPASKIIVASDIKRGLFVLRPDLSTPVAGVPRVDFTVDHSEVVRFQSQTFVDATEGFPSSWIWNITGPENKTSNLQNPTLTFNKVGDYDVKLKAMNSFGTDSILKSNVFHVTPASYPAFQIANPPGLLFRIFTSPGDTNKVLFNWTRSVISPDFFYKIYFKKLGGSPEEYILTGNNGRDSSMLLSKGYIDSMALRFGLTGDSVQMLLRVRIYGESDSGTSNTTVLTIRRTDTGIYIVNELIPSEYKLYNNYPNPFNPITNIKFDIPNTGFVNLTLYDISGKETSKLINENLSAGSYLYKLDANSLSSGIYFIRLNSENFSSSVRIMLVK